MDVTWLCVSVAVLVVCCSQTGSATPMTIPTTEAPLVSTTMSTDPIRPVTAPLMQTTPSLSNIFMTWPSTASPWPASLSSWAPTLSTWPIKVNFKPGGKPAGKPNKATTPDPTTPNPQSTPQNMDSTNRSSDSTTKNIDLTTQGADVTTQSADVTTQGVDVTTQGADVTTQSVDVTTMTADITTQTADVTIQSLDATTHSVDVTTQSADVTTQTADVATQTVDATTQTADVTTQTVDVTAQGGDATTPSFDSTTVNLDSTPQDPYSLTKNTDSPSPATDLTIDTNTDATTQTIESITTSAGLRKENTTPGTEATTTPFFEEPTTAQPNPIADRLVKTIYDNHAWKKRHVRLFQRWSKHLGTWFQYMDELQLVLADVESMILEAQSAGSAERAKIFAVLADAEANLPSGTESTTTGYPLLYTSTYYPPPSPSFFLNAPTIDVCKTYDYDGSDTYVNTSYILNYMDSYDNDTEAFVALTPGTYAYFLMATSDGVDDGYDHFVEVVRDRNSSGIELIAVTLVRGGSAMTFGYQDLELGDQLQPMVKSVFNNVKEVDVPIPGLKIKFSVVFVAEPEPLPFLDSSLMLNRALPIF